MPEIFGDNQKDPYFLKVFVNKPQSQSQAKVDVLFICFE